MATAAQDNKHAGGMNSNDRVWNILRMVGWSLAVILLLMPLIGMLFTNEVDWGLGDFVFAILILGGTGLLCELAIRRSNDNAYRIGALLALASTFLLVWCNAAVGFVGSGANTGNVLYFAMLAVPLIGGVITGFKARGMFGTMAVTAVVQAAVTAFVYAADLVQEDERVAILAINAIFILLWTGSGLLFRHAAERNA
jgi:cytochrome b561